jgi:hypothetical protein
MFYFSYEKATAVLLPDEPLIAAYISLFIVQG